MGLFKRFTETRQASKAERESFKAKLRYGTDPKEMYETARGHWEEYNRLQEETKEMLNKILKSPNCEKPYHWSKLDIQDYGDDCRDSPVGKHVYMNVYGSQNPKRNDATDCLCCGKELHRARNPDE